MGKNPGIAQRVKGNAQASSSAKAAEMLQNLSGYALNSDIPQIGIGTLLDDTFDSAVDSEFRMVVKKLSKKDALTKQKALEEMKTLIEEKSQDECIVILPYWCKSYTKLSVENDRKTRDLCQQVHEKLCSKVSKNLAPHLKQIMPYWILAQSDSYSSAGKIADNSFKATFNETKRPEVVNFAKDEIYNVLYDYLIIQTAKTLSDMKSCSEDEADQKYETIIVLSMRGLDLFLKYYFCLIGSRTGNQDAGQPSSSSSSLSNSFISEKLSKIFAVNSKFWKYSKDNSTKIRGEFFQLLNSLFDTIVLNQSLNQLEIVDANFSSFRKSLKAKIIPLMFYACDEDNYVSSFYSWQVILKCLKNFDVIKADKEEVDETKNNLWSLLNVKKAFIPKLISLIRNHSNNTAISQNSEIFCSSLILIVEKITCVFENRIEKLEFYKEFFSKLYDAVSKDSHSEKIRINNTAVLNRNRMVFALFDCLAFVIVQLIQNNFPEEIEFCVFSISKYILKTFEFNLLANNFQDVNDSISFEYKFQDFLQQIIEKNFEILGEKFWSELNQILDNKLNSNNQDENFEETYLDNFCNLFKSFWPKSSQKSREYLLILIQILFDKFHGSLMKTFKLEDRNEELNKHELNYLNCLTKLCTSFMNPILLDWFLIKQDLFNKEYNLDQKLSVFNDAIIGDTFVRTIMRRNSEVRDYSLYGIIHLFLVVNLNLSNSNEEANFDNYLNKFMFEISDSKGSLSLDSQQVENFIESYLTQSKNNKINSVFKLTITKFIVQNDRIKNLIVNKLFDAKKLFSFKQIAQNLSNGKHVSYNNYQLTIQLIDNLNASEISNNQTLNFFYKSLVKTTLLYIENINKKDDQNKFKKIKINELNNYLLFGYDLIFKKSNKLTSSLSDLNLLWPLLINHLILKTNVSKKIANMSVEKNLNNLINKLIQEFLETYNWRQLDNYAPLKQFLLKSLNDDETSSNFIDSFRLNQLLIRLIDHFALVMEPGSLKDWVFFFYSNVLFNLDDSIKFKELFNSILFCKDESINENIIANLYLDKRLNYLYSNYQCQLICKKREQIHSKNVQLISFKRINYSFTMLNSFFNSNLISNHESLIFGNDAKTINDFEWIYLILCSILLDKYDSNQHFNPNQPLEYLKVRILVKNIQSEFKKLLFDGNFFKLTLSQLTNTEDKSLIIHFIDCILKKIDGKERMLQLNNISLFITSLVDLTSEKVINLNQEDGQLVNLINCFSQNLILTLTDNLDSIELSEEEIKLYLYDIPFAKQSVIDNLNKLGENIQHYYDLFSHLIDEQVKQLAESVHKFKQYNKANDDKSDFIISLKTFNFNLDILTKYTTTYLSLLNKKSTSSTSSNSNLQSIGNKLFQILNCNEITLEFLRSNLSKNLIKIIELFIELKQSIASDSTVSKQNSYFFYFNFESDCNDWDLTWEYFIQIDKLNSFLQLFFIDYKLNILQMNNYSQQMSQYLDNKHWDFIMCYAAFITQSLNKVDHKKALYFNTSYYQIFSINFYSLVTLLIKCIHFRVKDGTLTSSFYIKNLYSDWCGFFSKELFDPLLCLFVKYAEIYSKTSQSFKSLYFSNLSIKNLEKLHIKHLCESVSLIPFERLLVNDLEAKFNVLDLDFSNLNVASSANNSSLIQLSDSLKSVINHLIPNLSHQIKSIQICSYKILRRLMQQMDKYCRLDELTENDSEQQKLFNIIESLPYVIRDSFSKLTILFADLKHNIQFDQNILLGKTNLDLNDEDLNYNKYVFNDEEFLEDEDDIEESIDELVIDNNKTPSIKHMEMSHDANNRIMSFLLINRLILDMFSSNDLQFKFKLVNNLREINFNEYLVHCLFRLMPSFKDSSLKFFNELNLMNESDDLDEYEFESLVKFNYEFKFSKKSDVIDEESFSNRNVQAFACKLYKFLLKSAPAMVRDWFNIQPKRTADLVDKYTTKYVSPVLLEEEIKQINRMVNTTNKQVAKEPILVEINPTNGPAKKTVILDDDEESTIKIRGMLSSREIVTTYKMKELNMELVIQLPINYPLGVVEVSSVKRLGVSENEWRNWLLQLTTYLTHQNGSIIQGLQIWKKNVDKKFSGVEECTICYSVIHGTNYTLPKMTCRTCKKKFHNICLYKWFESSSKSTCPLCRNLF